MKDNKLKKGKRTGIRKSGAFRSIYLSKKMGVGNDRYPNGVGFVILPSDFSREDYIKRVYQTGEVIITTNTGEVIKDVKIPKHIISDLEFPENTATRGSLVSWKNIPLLNQVIIDGVLFSPGDSYPYAENTKVRSVNETKGEDVQIAEQWNREEGSIHYGVTYDDEGNGFISPNIATEIYAKSPKYTSRARLSAEGYANLHGDLLTRVSSEEEVQIKIGSVESGEDTDEVTLLTINVDGTFTYIDRYLNEITIDGETGELSVKTNKKITLEAIDEDDQEGELEIRTDASMTIETTESDSILDIKSGATINIETIGSDGEVNITGTSKVNISANDEFRADTQVANINASQTVNLGTGLEPILKGTTTRAQLEVDSAKLDALIAAIAAAPVSPQDGGATLKAGIVAAMAAVPSANYSNIESQKSNTD